MATISSTQRNIRRHIVSDYGMSFRTMVNLIQNDPMELLYRLNQLDVDEIEQKQAKRRKRKHCETKVKKEAPTPKLDVNAIRKKTIEGLFRELS